MKMGGMIRKLKSVFNFTAGAQGSAAQVGVDWEFKAKNAVQRHTGVSIDSVGVARFNIDDAMPTWQGLGTEAVVQWLDGKTRHFGNISRKKLLDLAEEILPIMVAHNDASGTDSYASYFARSYHKQTQGYDMMGGRMTPTGFVGDWDVGRMNAYLGVKIARMVGNGTGLIPWINKKLPKGINL